MDVKLRIFGYAPSSAHKAAFTSWSGGPTEYRNLKVVDDDSYTHVALYYNGDAPATPNISHIPKEKVIAFLHEPFELVNINWNYIKDNVGTCIVHDKTKVPQYDCMKEYICYLPPGIPVGESHAHINTPKRFPMSIVASHKSGLRGHILRHQVIRRILATDMNIHIWGRGTEYMYRDQRIKGTTEHKPDMFAPYMFTIAIENAKYPWWVTEKFYDPILVNTVPLYWGADAANIKAVLGSEHSYIDLPDDLDGIMGTIRDVYDRAEQYYWKTPARDKFLAEANYAHFLWRHFNNDRLV